MRRSLLVVAVRSTVACVGLMLSTQGATAQSSTRIAPRVPHNPDYAMNPRADAAARAQDSVAGLRWMLPVTRDLTHYSVPMCLSGVMTIDMTARRRVTYDTVVVGDVADTLSRDARAFATSCLDRWPLASVPAQDLDAYLQLALAADNAAVARAAIDRRVHDAPDDSSKASVLIDAMNAVITAHPPRRAVADTIFRHVDALSAKAGLWKLVARYQYASALEHTGFDTTELSRTLGPLVAAQRHLTSAERLSVGSPVMTWQSGVNYAAVRMQADLLARLPLDSILLHYAWNIDDQDGQPRTTAAALKWELAQLPHIDSVGYATPETWGLKLAIQGRESPISMSMGPALWFASPGDTIPSTMPVHPTAGHVTLVTTVTRTNGSTDPNKAMLRRLYDRYGKDGLDIIMVDVTQGFAWNSPPLEPADEARALAWYYHDVCKLPFTLVVLTRKPHHTDQPSAADQADSTWAFGRHFPGSNFLIGRNGREYLSMSGGNPWWFEAEIRQALGLPAER